jgi:hypothetical protein
MCYLPQSAAGNKAQVYHAREKISVAAFRLGALTSKPVMTRRGPMSTSAVILRMSSAVIRTKDDRGEMSSTGL